MINPKYDGYQRGLVSMVNKPFDKKSSAGAVNSEIILKQHPVDSAHVAKVYDCVQQLPKESHKPIIRNFGKHKVYSSFKDSIWGADLAHMQLISKYNILFI